MPCRESSQLSCQPHSLSITLQWQPSLGSSATWFQQQLEERATDYRISFSRIGD